MQTPFYLRLRSLIQLESALREVGTPDLRSMVNTILDGESDEDDPCKQRLFMAELSRRRTTNASPSARASFLPPVPAP